MGFLTVGVFVSPVVHALAPDDRLTLILVDADVRHSFLGATVFVEQKLKPNPEQGEEKIAGKTASTVRVSSVSGLALFCSITRYLHCRIAEFGAQAIVLGDGRSTTNLDTVCPRKVECINLVHPSFVGMWALQYTLLFRFYDQRLVPEAATKTAIRTQGGRGARKGRRIHR